MTMYMEHDGPPDTKPRGSSGYLPGGASGEKAAPTAEEIAAARQHAAMLRDRFPERTRIENVAVALLAALDAAEALEKAAEDKLARACALADRTAASHVETRTRAETAERERDELRAKLARITERRFPIQRGPSIRWSVLAPHEAQARRNHSQTLEQLAERHGLDPVEAMAVYEDREYPRNVNLSETMAAWRALVERTDAEAQELAFRAALLPPGAIVVSDTEETLRLVTDAIGDAIGCDGNGSNEDAARAVLAAIREARP